MLTLTRDDVRLGGHAADGRAALDQAADALVQAGRVPAREARSDEPLDILRQLTHVLERV